jgi:hypothetical protein
MSLIDHTVPLDPGVSPRLLAVLPDWNLHATRPPRLRNETILRGTDRALRTVGAGGLHSRSALRTS